MSFQKKQDSHQLPPVPNCDELSQYGKKVADYDPEEVVVLTTPDASSVVPGEKRYLFPAHIKWVFDNIPSMADSYTKTPVTKNHLFKLKTKNAKELVAQRPEGKVRSP